MCSSPKGPKQPEQKKPQYLTNPWLDNLRLSNSVGRDSLRTDLSGTPGSTAASPGALPVGAPMGGPMPGAQRIYATNLGIPR